MSGHAVTSASAKNSLFAGLATLGAGSWTTRYLRLAALADIGCGLLAGLLAFQIRFDDQVGEYLAVSLALPLVWVATVALSGANDIRFVGVGTDEFRRVLNAGAFLIAAVAILSYAFKAELARGYVVIALPSLTAFDLLARFALRRHLHRARSQGHCMRRVVVVGHALVVADIVAVLRRETCHGLMVVAACVADAVPAGLLGETPIAEGLDGVPAVVSKFGADTVAVLACPEMAGARLRKLAWDLEKTGTDLCVAPALLDVAGPRTTIRPTAGLPLLHMDHPEFSGARLVVKGIFDRVFALLALVCWRRFSPCSRSRSSWMMAARRCSGRLGSAGMGAGSPWSSSARWCRMPRRSRPRSLCRFSRPGFSRTACCSRSRTTRD